MLMLGAPLFPCFAQDWPAPTPESRPGSRWWWLGSAVDEKNLAHNIAEYARAGIGSLEITPIYGVKGNENNDISYLSPRWMEMLCVCYAEAARNGIRIEMNNGTGWPFGGPEVTPATAAKKSVFTKDPATGKTKLSITGTSQKVKRAAPGGEGFVMDHLDKDVVLGYLSKFDKAFDSTGTPYPPVFFNDSYEVYGADWTPTLLEEFHRRRHYRLEDHFEEFTDTARGETTRRIVSDYRQTMSELLLENFLKPWTEWAHSHGSLTRNQAHGSPANLIDAYACVDIPECEGFGLSDFGIKGLRKDSISKKNDSDLSMLKYASSAADITGKRLVSSETFTWLTDHFRTSLSQCKPDMDLMFIAGVNHMFFHGTPYSPREAQWPGWLFYASVNMSPTNTIWRDAPAFFDYITRCQSMLQTGSPDNDFLLYLPIYDLWDELPGRMVAFGIHQMDRYAPKFIATVNSIISNGYNVDYISDALLEASVGKDGAIMTPGGAIYDALVIPGVRIMPVETLRKALDLAAGGATVVFVGSVPDDVPGFLDHDKRRETLENLISQTRIPGSGEASVAYGKGRIILADSYDKALAMTDKDNEPMRPELGLSYLRRTTSDGHLYFISNLQPEDVDAYVTIACPGTDNMLLDPMTGKRGRITLRGKGDKRQARLQLKSGESVFLQTFDHPLDRDDIPEWKYPTEMPGATVLDRGWTLSFPQSEPAIAGSFDIGSTRSWTTLDLPEASTNAGTGLYSTTFELPSTDCDDWILDLGDVRESARVRVNGKEVATLWAVPFRTPIGEYLRPGSNTLEVEVTNLPANRISQMDREGKEWRIFKDANIARLGRYKGDFSSWTPVPSGLNSDVRLIPVSYSTH